MTLAKTDNAARADGHRLRQMTDAELRSECEARMLAVEHRHPLGAGYLSLQEYRRDLNFRRAFDERARRDHEREQEL